jgi:hypothetical protein
MVAYCACYMSAVFAGGYGILLKRARRFGRVDKSISLTLEPTVLSQPAKCEDVASSAAVERRSPKLYRRPQPPSTQTRAVQSEFTRRIHAHAAMR